MITFEPKTHTYRDENGNEYISVTTLLSREFPFDQKAIADKVSKISSSRYHGMSQNRILKMWEDSSGHGNVVHEAVEEYIKDDVWPSDPILVPLIKQFSQLNFSGDLLSETLVWDEKYMIAGMVDVLEFFPDKINLYDIKTSHRITDDKLMKFSLQVGIYKKLTEKIFKKPVHLTRILNFDDYVIKRSDTKLKTIVPLDLDDVVSDILRKRLIEITKGK